MNPEKRIESGLRRIVAAGIGYVFATGMGHGQMNTIVEETFGGTKAVLNGTTAETFDAAITSAGGSGTWVAGTNLLDNGTVNVESNSRSAYLSMGSYINSAKGTATGKFEVTMTISETTGSWISLGFASEIGPNIAKNFTNTGSGAATTTGLGTIIYRAQTASPAGELDMFGGNGNANPVDGPDGNTGSRTLTVTLDLTTAGGYNGTSNFGTVSWRDSVLGDIGSFTYAATRNFGSILISEASTSGGAVGGLTLKQLTVDLPPTLAGKSPADNAADVATSASMVATFSEAIQAGSGNVTLRKTADNTTVESFDVASSPRLAFNGNQLTIDPTNNLEPGVEYYVLIDATAGKDASNHAFTGIDSAGQWNFLTDDTPPALVVVNPSAATGYVPPTGSLTMTFDENVQPATGMVTVHLAADDSVVESIDVTTAGVVTVNGSAVTILRSVSLARNTAYYVKVDPGAFTDLSGIDFEGITDEATWTFVTSAVLWKQSNSLNHERVAGYMSGTAGMNGAGTSLYNLDGTEAGEPTIPNGVSWNTSSKGNPATAATAGRVWIIADLGATYDRGTLTIWNFQWYNGGTSDLSNRGVSQFDVYVRNAVADTDDGTAAGIPINLDNPADDLPNALANDAVFNSGTSNQWQLALENRQLAQAPNTDKYAGESFSLTGRTARFVAIVVDGYYGGGIGLGKVRLQTSVPSSPFVLWQQANTTSQAIGADHDGDAVSNGIEYFLGGTSNTTGFTAQPEVSGSGGVSSITWNKSDGYPGGYGVDYVVQTSETMEAGSWADVATGTGPNRVDISGTMVKYTFPAGSVKFARLKVTGP